MATVACPASPGEGGLGRHFAELLHYLRSRGELTRYYASDILEDGVPGGVVVRTGLPAITIRLPPARFDARVRTHLANALFDKAVAAIFEPADRHFGFTGQSLRTFRRAAAHGVELVLVSPTAHVAYTHRRYAAAFARYPFEQPWLGHGLAIRTEAEYDLAGRIQVASEYVRQSFLEAGFSPERLEHVDLSPADRFRSDSAERPKDGVFRILYIGGLTVVKGIPVLVEAFRRLSVVGAELTLVGGWSSRGMRRYMLDAVARDPRIMLVLGDPLPYLRRADVYVHPSFQDGFGYAPMEALACGVPVIVTEDTGMKEHVREGANGYVVPTGDVDALVERLMALRLGALERT